MNFKKNINVLYARKRCEILLESGYIESKVKAVDITDTFLRYKYGCKEITAYEFHENIRKHYNGYMKHNPEEIIYFYEK